MSDNGNDKSLKEKTAQGLFWGLFSSGGTQLLNLIIGIFLARLLSPNEYGIVGLLAIFILIAGNLQDSGFGVALINIKNIKHNDYNSVFWFNTIVTLAIYAILFFCAPLIAAFYHQPCLTDLSRFVFLAFIFAALGIVPNAILVRNLRIKEKAIITILALSISGIVGIVMAFKGFSYWSLATQQVLYNAITCVGRYICTRWYPSLHIDFTPVKQMFAFSYKVLITTVLGTISNNILTVIFGRLFPAHAVGNYTQANKWNTMANSLISGSVSQVAQPVLTTINDEKDRQTRVFRKMLRFTAFLAFPAMFGLALVAPQLIIATIGNQWVDSIPMLQILCIGGAFIPFYTIYQNLFLSRGKSNIYMWLNIAQIVILVTTVLLCRRWGIMAMVIAFACLNILWLLPWQVMTQREIGLRLRGALKDIVPFLVISVAVMAATWALTTWTSNIYILFVTRIVIAVALYFAAMKLLHVKIFDECMEFFKKRIKKRSNA